MKKNAALERLRARVKSQPSVPKTQKVKLFRTKGVDNSAELQRILELPEYNWEEDEELEEVAQFLKDTYGRGPQEACRRKCGHETRQKPGECDECDRASAACMCRGDGDMSLRPIQAAALMQLHDFGGLAAPIRVGGGKTLISYLSPSVCGAERFMLLVPAKLRKKTRREFHLLRRHWQPPKRLYTMSYELLARERGLAEIQAFSPDLIFADEAHKLKNTQASVTQVLRWYLCDFNEECHYADTSGTYFNRSITEAYHRFNWAIPDGLQPLPRDYNQLKDWADAIDEKTSPLGRLMPGALYQFCTDEEMRGVEKDPSKTNQIRTVRTAMQRRILSAPAVIGSREQFDGAMSLTLKGVEWEPSEAVVDAFKTLREKWERPDGMPIDDPPVLWQVARCLVQGFYYRLEPEAPKEWLMVRKEWARCVREILKNYHDIWSPAAVAKQIELGRPGIQWAAPVYHAWVNIRETFTPNPVPEWLDDNAVQFCAKWAKKHRGIIWVNETALGHKLQEVAGLPYYGSKGLCGSKMIEEETKTCVASIKANSEGRNLQQFSENLVAAPPPGGNTWEQLMGRTHRDGQEADEVNFQVVEGCYENWKVVQQALRDAEFAERLRGQSQKLLYADLDLQSAGDIVDREDDPLWSKENADYFDDDHDWTEKELAISDLSVAERAARRREAYGWGS